MPFLSRLVISLAQIAGNTYATTSNVGFGNPQTVLQLLSNGTGTITGTGGFVTVNFNWATPTTVGVGSSYWVKFTAAINANTGGVNSFTATTAWLALSATQSAQVTADSTVISNIDVTYTVQIASDAAGTNIVHTATVRLQASVAA